MEKVVIMINKKTNSFTLGFLDGLKNQTSAHRSLLGITFRNNNIIQIDDDYFIGDSFNSLKSEEEKIRFCTNRQSFLSNTSKKSGLIVYLIF